MGRSSQETGAGKPGAGLAHRSHTRTLNAGSAATKSVRQTARAQGPSRTPRSGHCPLQRRGVGRRNQGLAGPGEPRWAQQGSGDGHISADTAAKCNSTDTGKRWKSIHPQPATRHGSSASSPGSFPERRWHSRAANISSPGERATSRSCLRGPLPELAWAARGADHGAGPRSGLHGANHDVNCVLKTSTFG